MELTGNTKTNRNSIRYERKCGCGASVWTLRSNFRTKVCKDCRNKQLSEKKKTHGQSGYVSGKGCVYSETSPAYISWQTMKRRCFGETTKYYARYGGRGISVCQNWLGLKGFNNFLADMGQPPIEANGKTYQLDRIDNDGDYDKDNCRWVTHKDNSRNSSRVLRYTHNGLDFCVTKWVDLIGMKYSMFSDRYYRFGWGISEALGFVSVSGKLGAIKKPSKLNWLAEKSLKFNGV
jgi:hypothetical protein